MSELVSVDGIYYDIKIRSGDIARTASILDGKNAGRLKSGDMELDTIGTYYNYDVTFLRSGDNVEAYDALYEVLTDPVNRVHDVSMPYAQSSINFKAYVATVADKLIKQKLSKSYWSGMEVSFIGMKPYRRS